MKKILILLAVCILVSGIVTTIYFYFQHKIVVYEHQMNKEIDVQNATISLEKLTLRSSERKHHIVGNWLTRLAIQEPMFKDFLKVGAFYTSPYERLDFNVLTIRATMKGVNKELVSDFQHERLKIELQLEESISLEEYGITYINTGESVKCEIKYKLFENASDIQNREISIIINHEAKKYNAKIEIQPKWQKKTYHFFNREDTLRISSLR